MLEIVQQLDEKLQQQKASLTTYYEYYKGNHPITIKESKTSSSSTREVHNFCKLFIDNNTGFLLGNNTQLKYATSTEEDNIVDIYNDMVGNRVQQLDQKLLRDIQIFGYAYEINYINKNGNFDIAIKTPLEIAVNREGNKVVNGLLYQGNLNEDIEVYDLFLVRENKIIRLHKEDDKFKVSDSAKVNPIDNPIIVVYNNWEKQSEMADIMTLNDSYNQVSSDATSEIHDFRNAYLHFNGAKITEEVLKDMNKSGVISTPEKADVQFITKDINSNFIENKLTQLERKIYDISGQVNFNDSSLGSNTSSLALRNKLTNLINKLSLKEGFLKESMNIRVRNLSKYIEINTVGVTETHIEELYNPSKVDINFIMNIPTSDKETAEMVIALFNAGLLSKESAVSQLSFINIVQDELDKIETDLSKDTGNIEQFMNLLELEDDTDETIR